MFTYILLNFYHLNLIQKDSYPVKCDFISNIFDAVIKDTIYVKMFTSQLY